MENIKLNFLHICENAFTDEKGRLSVINIFDEIRSKGLPAIHSRFSIVSNISGELREYKQKIKIISPSNKEIVGVEGDIKTTGKNNFIVNFLNVVFPEIGKYQIQIFVNDEQLPNDFYIELKPDK